MCTPFHSSFLSARRSPKPLLLLSSLSWLLSCIGRPEAQAPPPPEILPIAKRKGVTIVSPLGQAAGRSGLHAVRGTINWGATRGRRAALPLPHSESMHNHPFNAQQEYIDIIIMDNAAR